MDTLSAELISMVVDYIERNNRSSCAYLGPYACISRRFQYEVEARTLSSIDLTSRELQQFAVTFCDSRRRSLLSYLNYGLELPTYSVIRIRKHETPAEEAANNRAFGDELRTLIALLRSWKDAAQAVHAAPRPLTLRLYMYSPMDVGYRSSAVWKGLGIERSRGRYVELDDAPLDSLELVTTLQLDVRAPRELHPRTIGRVVAAMSNMSKLEIELDQPRMKLEDGRREHRDGEQMAQIQLPP